MTKRMLIMLGLVILLVAALAFGKFLQIKQLIASAPKPGAQTVTATTLKSLDWQPQFSSVGTLIPVRGVDVTTEIAGLVRTVNFKSGQEVKAGELLVQLNADADIALLRSLEAAAELSASVLARDRQQLGVQTISQAQYDADAADLKAKRANVAQQAATVAKKTIRAPFAGKLGITTLQPGQYLNPADKIVTLQTIDPIYVDFSLPQKQLAGLHVGQKLNLASDAYSGQSFEGLITAISPKVDSATRNVLIEATIANEQRLLLPGMFVDVKVDAGDKQRYLTLPQTAITYNPYGSTVFVLKPADQVAADTSKDGKPGDPKKPETKAEAKPAASAPAAGAKSDPNTPPPLVAEQVFVTTGATRGDQVAILSGLKEGQQVVTSGQLKLKNGTPVIIDNSVQPANDPSPTPQEK